MNNFRIKRIPKIPMTFEAHHYSLHIFRRIIQIVFILLIFLMPVLNIFRYDSATKELIVFGQIWSLGLKQGFYTEPRD